MIGYEESGQLDVEPALYFVRVIKKRPKIARQKFYSINVALFR